jgi:hypothetical protein
MNPSWISRYDPNCDKNPFYAKNTQRDRDPKTGLLDLLVYYEVPLGQRDEVKRKFNAFV